MTDLEKIAAGLREHFPAFRFSIYRGLHKKYIAMINLEHVVFTIWVDPDSGAKEVLDEIHFPVTDWWQRQTKSRFFHWTKFRKLPSVNNPVEILKKWQLRDKDRARMKERVIHYLATLHLTAGF